RPHADRGGRLAHAALLVTQGDDARRAVALERCRHLERALRATGGAGLDGLRREVHAVEFGRLVPLCCHPDIPSLLWPPCTVWPAARAWRLVPFLPAGAPKPGLTHGTSHRKAAATAPGGAPSCTCPAGCRPSPSCRAASWRPRSDPAA